MSDPHLKRDQMGPFEWRCHTFRGHHIPGCGGCAEYGHEQCTCPEPADEGDELRELVAKVERRMAALEVLVHREFAALRAAIEKGDRR